MWKYYLLCCAGALRSRILQVWQFVYSTTGVPEGYVTKR
jgi:cyclopropane-fatty-acyl-phospholipid synthase